MVLVDVGVAWWGVSNFHKRSMPGGPMINVQTIATLKLKVTSNDFQGNLLNQSGQIIATSKPRKGSLVGESSQHSLKSGSEIIVVPSQESSGISWGNQSVWGSETRIGTREKKHFFCGSFRGSEGIYRVALKNCIGIRFHRVDFHSYVLFLLIIMELTTGYNPAGWTPQD